MKPDTTQRDTKNKIDYYLAKKAAYHRLVATGKKSWDDVKSSLLNLYETIENEAPAIQLGIAREYLNRIEKTINLYGRDFEKIRAVFSLNTDVYERQLKIVTNTIGDKTPPREAFSYGVAIALLKEYNKPNEKVMHIRDRGPRR